MQGIGVPADNKELPIPLTGLIVISASRLTGIYSGDKNRYEWLRKYAPFDCIGGGSILLFNIPEHETEKE